MAVSTETPNELMVVFSNTVSAGFDAVSGAVTGVFGLMIALVVALTGIQWALSQNRDVLASGFGKILLIGAFAWLINDWQALSETIYDGFIAVGLLAGGGGVDRSEFLNPGSIVEQGWIITKAFAETPMAVENPLDVAGNLLDALILAIAMLGIMLSFAVLALQIIIALLEFKIVTLGGFVLLPFGIWSKSAFLAERPLGYVVSSGLKVLALAIVVSGARTVFDQLVPSENPDIYEALTILVAALLLAMLAISIPNLAAALVTGGPALGAGAALGGGLAVGGAALLAGGAVGKLGGAALGAGRGSSSARRISSSSRSAAGATGGGRSGPSPSRPSPPASPPPAAAPHAPSNDNGPSTPPAAPTAAPRPATATGSGSRPSSEDMAAGAGKAPSSNEKSGSGKTGRTALLVEEANGQRRREARAEAKRTAASAGSGGPLFDRNSAPASPTSADASASNPAPANAAAASPRGATNGSVSGPAAKSAATSASSCPSAASSGPTTPASSPTPGPTSASGGSAVGPTAAPPQAQPRRERDSRSEQRSIAGRRARGSAAMQAFFTANAARAVLPSDSVGSLTPDLKREDS